MEVTYSTWLYKSIKEKQLPSLLKLMFLSFLWSVRLLSAHWEVVVTGAQWEVRMARLSTPCGMRSVYSDTMVDLITIHGTPECCGIVVENYWLAGTSWVFFWRGRESGPFFYRWIPPSMPFPVSFLMDLLTSKWVILLSVTFYRASCIHLLLHIWIFCHYTKEIFHSRFLLYSAVNYTSSSI